MPSDFKPGPTWTEAWRHECEVRYVCSLVPSARRHEYIEGNGLSGSDHRRGVRQIRGDTAADRLAADARALWATGWRPGKPHPPEGQERRAQQAAVDASGEPSSYQGNPGLGSLLGACSEGPLRRDRGVDSGVSLQ